MPDTQSTGTDPLSRAHKYPAPSGQLSARTHGAVRILQQAAASARLASREPGVHPEHAAALRGKAVAFKQAADVMAALERGRRLPKLHTKPQGADA